MIEGYFPANVFRGDTVIVNFTDRKVAIPVRETVHYFESREAFENWVTNQLKDGHDD